MQEARKPYSERLGRWMTPRAMPAGIAFIDDVRRFKTAAAHNDYAALTTPLPAEAEGEAGNLKYATVVLYDDPVDPYVSVDNVSIKVKRKKRNVATENIVKYLKIPPAVAQNISSALAQDEAAG
jgi:hypothetical protein